MWQGKDGVQKLARPTAGPQAAMWLVDTQPEARIPSTRYLWHLLRAARAGYIPGPGLSCHLVWLADGPQGPRSRPGSEASGQACEEGRAMPDPSSQPTRAPPFTQSWLSHRPRGMLPRATLGLGARDREGW